MIEKKLKEPKVGQVYRFERDGTICVCTNDKWAMENGGRYHFIEPSGNIFFHCMDHLEFEKAVVISEYSTWIEAINSKEFNSKENK